MYVVIAESLPAAARMAAAGSGPPSGGREPLVPSFKFLANQRLLARWALGRDGGVFLSWKTFENNRIELQVAADTRAQKN